MLGSALSIPFAVAIGRRMKHKQGGVPIVPQQRFVHDFPNLEPGRAARLNFRWYYYGTMIVTGYVFAQFMTRSDTQNNWWYNRPDLKPHPHMVAQEDIESRRSKVAHETMMNTSYVSYRN